MVRDLAFNCGTEPFSPHPSGEGDQTQSGGGGLQDRARLSEAPSTPLRAVPLPRWVRRGMV